MILGYARVSTKEQNLDLQLDALKVAHCDKVYQEKISGARSDRPELEKLLEHLRAGDEVIVWKLDRLGRSLPDLVKIINQIEAKGGTFRSIQDSHINTNTPQGKLIFNIFASLAEFERDIIRERTKAGLEAARARGRIGGRPKGLSEQARQTAFVAASLYREGSLSVNQICGQLRIAKNTLYSYLRNQGVQVGKKSLSK